MRLTKFLLAALLSSLTVYLLVRGGEARAEMLTAIGVDLRPNMSMVVCIQGLVVGLIFGASSDLRKKLLYEAIESFSPLLLKSVDAIPRNRRPPVLGTGSAPPHSLFCSSLPLWTWADTNTAHGGQSESQCSQSCLPSRSFSLRPR